MTESYDSMHVVSVGSELGRRLIWAREMEIGDVAVIEDQDALKWHNGHVIMRTYIGFVSLNNPRMTWKDKPPPYRVRLVQDAVTINFGNFGRRP